MIQDGNTENIPNLLGSYFYIKGRVITGDRIGRTLSYHTANIHYPENIIKLQKGVYAVLVEIDEKKYKGMANFGRRPTVNGKNLLLETHIFDFNENIYDKDIKVYFCKKIRNETKFCSLPELKSQLVKDEIAVREYFSKNKI